MKKVLKSLLSDERGTETVEWALIVGMLVGGLILTLAAIGVWVKARFDTLQSDLVVT